MGGYPSFPSLPSPANPYVAAAAEAGSGAARLATSLREAANQQEVLKQQAADKAATQKRQDASDLAGALREGAVPLPGALPQPGAAPPSGGLPPLGTRPTLKRPDDPPSSGSPFSAPDDQGQTTAQAQPAGRSPGLGAQASAETSDYSFDPQRIVNRGGTPVYYPTAEEKAAVEAKSKKANETQDDTNSFVLSPTAATAMNEAGYANVKAGDRIPMAHAATVTEAVKAHLTKSALDDTNSVQITQSMVDKLAPHGITLKPGARVSLEKAGELKSLLEMAEPKAEKPDATQIIPGYTGPGGGPVLLNKSDQSASEIKLPPGSKQSESESARERQQRFTESQQTRQDARDQRREDQQQKVVEGAQKSVDQLQTKEQEQHAKRQAYGSVLATPNGGKVIDPDTREQYTMNPTRRQFYQDRLDKATAMAGQYHDQATKIIQRHGGTAPPPLNSGPKVKVWNEKLGRFD